MINTMRVKYIFLITLGDAEQQPLMTEIIWLWVLLCCLKLIINCTFEIAISNIILGFTFFNQFNMIISD